MSLPVTKDQEDLAESISRWATDGAFLDQARSMVDVPATARSGEIPPWWPDAVGMGLTGLALPESVGGVGANVQELSVVLAELGRHMAMGPLLPGSVGALVLMAARAHAPAAHAFDELLHKVAEGEAIVVAAQVGALNAVSTANGWSLSGELPTVLGAEFADWILVKGRESTGGEAWFALEVTDEVAITILTSLDVTRPLSRVLVANVEVPKTAVLSGVDSTLVNDLYLTLVGAEAVGLARWAQETATAYAKVREQFGRTIGSFQSIKHMCADMFAQQQIASAASYDAAMAATSYLNGPDKDTRAQLALAAAAVSAVGIEDVLTTTYDCIQVHGGIGMTWEHNAHLFVRRAMTFRQLCGDASAAQALLTQMGREGIWRQWTVALTGVSQEWRDGIHQLVDSLPQDELARRIAMADAGLIAPHWRRPYGMEATPLEQLVIAEELTSAEIPIPDLVVGKWSMPTLIELGTEEQREKFILPTLRGDIIWCQLFSEPGAGSDLSGLRMRATRVDGGWSLTGQKVWTSLAMEADWGICLARSNPDVPNSKGITYFLVDMKTPGIEVRPLREVTGDAWFNEVFMDDVFVPDNMVVGKVDEGWNVARATLAVERTAITSNSSVGAGLEDILASSPPNPVADAYLGGIVARIQVSAALGQQITLKQLEGMDPSPAASIRKLAQTQQSGRLSAFGLTSLGTAGLDLTDELSFARGQAFMFGRAGGIGGGTTQMMRNIIGERLLGLPRD